MNTLKRAFKQKEAGITLIFIAMCLIVGFVNPNFFNYQNLLSVFGVASYTAIFAIGELLVILMGCIDLTVGSTIGFTSVVACLLLTRTGLPLLVVLLFTIMTGMIIGFINGFFVNVVNLPPFIATLGMSQIIKSASLLLTDARPVMGVGEEYIFIGKGTFLKVPVCVWIMLVVAIIFSIFLNKTVTGRRLFAAGGNAEAAKFSGINVKFLKWGVYVVSGACSALAAIIISAKLGSAQGATGTGYENDAIASTIIGGTAFSGGEGSVYGTVFGACIMAVIRNALVLLSVSVYVQSMVIGIIIIGAVTIDILRQNAAQKVSKKFIQEAIESQTK